MNSLKSRIDASVNSAVQALCANSGWRVYAGPQQEQLIASLGKLAGCEEVGLASSGTAALELLLRACQLDEGDEVLLSGYDYPGNFSAIERVRARPVLVDVEPDCWNIDLESLEAAYKPSCRALVVSHLHGQLQPMAALEEWCQRRDVWLIQDACQSLGATSTTRSMAGWGDATIISFGGSKLISAGRGGAWLTRDAQLAQHARRAAGAGSGAYELSELQAAVILAQLPYLPELAAVGRAFFATLHERLVQSMPGLAAPWWTDRQVTAFYQAGWLVPEEVDFPAGQEIAGLEWGRGFAGFHKRSGRRARIEQALTNVQCVAGRTMTLHHRLSWLSSATDREH